MAAPTDQKFRFRKDSPFSAEESKFIVLKYGETGKLKYTAVVRRAFGIKFYPKNKKKVPNQKAFH